MLYHSTGIHADMKQFTSDKSYVKAFRKQIYNQCVETVQLMIILLSKAGYELNNLGMVVDFKTVFRSPHLSSTSWIFKRK